MKVFLIIAVIFSYTSAASINSRILGGKVATRGQFPYQVSVDYYAGEDHFQTCGGAILSPNWILTAAHCTRDYSKLRVVAGILSSEEDDPFEANQAIDVEAVIVHPDYPSTGSAPNDIALLKLSEPLKFSDEVSSVQLPEPDVEAEGWTVAAGWGLTEDGYADQLLYIEVPILPTSACGEIFDKLLNITNTFDATVNMCIGPLTGEFAVCIGDSGSPVVQDGTVVGLVSWGMIPCLQVGYPAVLTKVSHYNDFIKKYVIDL